MKELTVFEMNAISGGYSWDFSSIQSAITSLVSNGVEATASAALGAVTWGTYGLLWGGTQSGANGGILGLGLIGNAVGAVWGTLMGALGGAVGYAALGWDASVNESLQSMLGIIDGSFVPWSH
ncbi:hypothetical protein AAHW42_23010 [Klebsiella quasipneumoniae subsp. similipneumoniae]|uniref:hypothetical protein n=2 Tax=Klebsiella quasipneumoniae TaxID=1463165 RepID=UPI002D7C206C|nr:hypothetical protein [Klebsiella pneumoniae]HBR1083484.1 hypothetical protein [Klebsiella quasipneumoniae subsp. similipneumoniae]HBT4679817.1 hypothetical protein [Klebsiella pneumoniae]HBW3402982.1 hypothetical protein [Klebsiella pneumoniae]